MGEPLRGPGVAGVAAVRHGGVQAVEVLVPGPVMAGVRNTWRMKIYETKEIDKEVESLETASRPSVTPTIGELIK